MEVLRGKTKIVRMIKRKGSYMKKIIINVLLVLGVIVPVTMLFWPFVYWGGAMSLILRIIPSFSVQLLFCRLAKHKAIEAIPFLLTGAFALWATDLYITSPSWSNASFWDYVADCLSPFFCCLVVYLVSVFLVERKEKHGCVEGNKERES